MLNTKSGMNAGDVLAQVAALLAQRSRERDELVRNQAQTDQAIEMWKHLTRQIARDVATVVGTPQFAGLAEAALSVGRDLLQNSLMRATLSPCDAGQAATELYKAYEVLVLACITTNDWLRDTRTVTWPIPFRRALVTRVSPAQIRGQVNALQSALNFAVAHAMAASEALLHQHDWRTYLGAHPVKCASDLSVGSTLSLVPVPPTARDLDDLVCITRDVLEAATYQLSNVVDDGYHKLNRGTYRVESGLMNMAGSPVMPSAVSGALAALVEALSSATVMCALLSGLTLGIVPA